MYGEKTAAGKTASRMKGSRSRNFIIDMRTGFYNRRFFNLRLREEHRRTDRSGSPFSVLRLEFLDLANSIEKRPKLRIHQMKKVITNIVRNHTRDTDIKCWTDDTTLRILMPQTSEAGAKALAKKLPEMVNDALGTFFGLERGFDPQRNLGIESYPGDMKEAGKPSRSRPSLHKQSVARQKNPKDMREEYHLTGFDNSSKY
jgi:GGDEF domain-containing protein